MDSGIINTGDNTIGCVDVNIGQVDNGVTVEEINSEHGQHYWKATTQITGIFGADLSEQGGGPILEGIGTTEVQARERLKVKLKEFNDSLWFN